MKHKFLAMLWDVVFLLEHSTTISSRPSTKSTWSKYAIKSYSWRQLLRPQSSELFSTFCLYQSPRLIILKLHAFIPYSNHIIWNSSYIHNYWVLGSRTSALLSVIFFLLWFIHFSVIHSFLHAYCKGKGSWEDSMATSYTYQISTRKSKIKMKTSLLYREELIYQTQRIRKMQLEEERRRLRWDP